MTEINSRPIIFPLSNPVSLSECTFAEAVEWSSGRAIFASGSPFAPQSHIGRTLTPGQGNNMYVFPGIGLGAALGRSSIITDSMVTTASLSLASSLTPEEHAAGLIYPRITRIREISAQIARDVIIEARKEKLTTNSAVASLRDDQVLGWVKERMWNPVI